MSEVEGLCLKNKLLMMIIIYFSKHQQIKFTKPCGPKLPENVFLEMFEISDTMQIRPPSE